MQFPEENGSLPSLFSSILRCLGNIWPLFAVEWPLPLLRKQSSLMLKLTNTVYGCTFCQSKMWILDYQVRLFHRPFNTLKKIIYTGTGQVKSSSGAYQIISNNATRSRTGGIFIRDTARYTAYVIQWSVRSYLAHWFHIEVALKNFKIWIFCTYL